MSDQMSILMGLVTLWANGCRIRRIPAAAPAWVRWELRGCSGDHRSTLNSRLVRGLPAITR